MGSTSEKKEGLKERGGESQAVIMIAGEKINKIKTRM